MRKIIFVFVALVVVLNVVVSARSKSELVDLSVLDIGAVAPNNSMNNGRLGPTVQFGCVVVTKVIMGHYADGTANIQDVPFPGEEARCSGISGSCSPHLCIQYF